MAYSAVCMGGCIVKFEKCSGVLSHVPEKKRGARGAPSITVIRGYPLLRPVWVLSFPTVTLIEERL